MNQPNDELDLLRRLRQLPREREPGRDLWTGIEARLDSTPKRAHAPRARSWGWIGVAAAASIVLAIGLASRPGPDTAPIAASETAARPTRTAPGIVRREAEALTIEYRLALEPFAAAPLPRELGAAAADLDASAQQLRRALRAQPDAIYLLDRLRRTYDQRLKLTQRAMLG